MSVAEEIVEKSETLEIGRIHLVRHGKPDLSRKTWLSRQGFNAWWAEYGRVGLAGDQVPPQEISEIAVTAKAILSSPIPRAQETAALLAGGQEVRVDAAFVEAPLPAPFVLPLLHITPPLWGTLARFTWWLGYSAGGETRFEAELRAEAAADQLIHLAASCGGDVLICGHGWFNHMMGRQLKQRGWRRESGEGRKGYWSHSSFASPV